MNSVAEGGCLCGAVRYQVRGEPLAKSLCHCRTCRLASGAPSVAWVVFKSGDFEFIVGRAMTYSSSPGVTRAFCGDCGTPLTYQSASRMDTIDVTTVSLDHPEDFAPTEEIWVEHRLSWEALNAALPHHSRGSNTA